MKEEIQKEINKLKKQVDRLEAKLKEPESWKPQHGNYAINGTGDVGVDYGTEKYALAGASHLNIAQAEKHAKAIKRFNWLYQLVLELNEGWEVDFTDGKRKYYLFFDACAGYYFTQYWESVFPVSTPVFKDKATAERAIEIIETWAL